MEHPFGWLSLLPPAVAILLAIVTQRVVPSLLVGILVGGLVLEHGSLLPAVSNSLTIHLWPTLADWGKLRVFAFTLLMGSMIGIVNRCGGMRGLVNVVSVWARNRREGQMVVWALGLFVFFDDYANTLLLGTTLRPLTDRLRISRQKLAYLVDSTAAPVAGLAVVSTWVAVEIGYIQDGLDKLPIDGQWNAFAIFVQSIPYRFYVLWALLFIPIVAWLGRDMGPMLHAERNSLRSGPRATRDSIRNDSHSHYSQISARWYNAIVPIGVTVGSIMYLLYSTGRAQFPAGADPTIWKVLGESNSYSSLFWGALAGAVVAAAMSALQRLLSLRQIVEAAAHGARLMVPALIILWLASSLSSMAGNKPSKAGEAISQDTPSAAMEGLVRGPDQDDPSRSLEAANPYPYSSYRLYTGSYLGELLEENLPVWTLPTLVFLLSVVVAFSTGTSFGTMGIIMPLAIPLVHSMLTSNGNQLPAADPIFLAAISGVLAGAIFGDHCSPISDTTVLSSQASGCDHVAHVRTQLPYALLVGAVSIVCGTLPIGLGVPVWVLLPLGPVLLAVLLRVLGKPVVDQPIHSSSSG